MITNENPFGSKVFGSNSLGQLNLREGIFNAVLTNSTRDISSRCSWKHGSKQAKQKTLKLKYDWVTLSEFSRDNMNGGEGNNFFPIGSPVHHGQIRYCHEISSS